MLINCAISVADNSSINIVFSVLWKIWYHVYLLIYLTIKFPCFAITQIWSADLQQTILSKFWMHQWSSWECLEVYLNSVPIKVVPIRYRAFLLAFLPIPEATLERGFSHGMCRCVIVVKLSWIVSQIGSFLTNSFTQMSTKTLWVVFLLMV